MFSSLLDSAQFLFLYPKKRYEELPILLGEGMGGSVYKGLDSYTGEFVAIKKIAIYQDDIPVDFILKMISNEVYILHYLTKIGCEHCLKFIDSYYENETFYIITEFLSDYQTLDKIKNNITDEHKIILFSSILKTIRFLHKHGIAHLDLKPENIMIKRPNYIKIIDFGSSCFLKKQPIFHKQLIRNVPSSMSLKLHPCEMMSDVDFAPPQQQQTTNFSKYDSWSLGITLFELFARGNPIANLIENFDSNLQKNINHIIDKNISNAHIRKLLRQLLTVDENERPYIKNINI